MSVGVVGYGSDYGLGTCLCGGLIRRNKNVSGLEHMLSVFYRCVQHRNFSRHSEYLLGDSGSKDVTTY